jgi:hypothetical protein
MPEFSLIRSVEDNALKYKVAVSWVPDPGQRYTLRVNPSWLSNVGFTFAFNDAGGVDNVGVTQKDQVVPTNAAIGAFAAAVATVVPFTA